MLQPPVLGTLLSWGRAVSRHVDGLKTVMLFSEFVLCTEGGLGLTSNFRSLLRAVLSILLEELLEQQTGT